MRRKIEIHSDEWHEVDGPETAPDGMAPEIADHINPADAADPPASETVEPASSTGAADYITALQAELEDVRKQLEDAKRQTLFVQAEFQNFRRRKEDEQKDLARFANREFAKNLLPVLDNFERALQAAEKTHNFDALIAGISGTSKQLQASLAKIGVTQIEAVGKEFDPNYHEAIGHSDSAEYAPNTVAEEVQRGYMMHDRVLRPALVKVAQG